MKEIIIIVAIIFMIVLVGEYFLKKKLKVSKSEKMSPRAMGCRNIFNYCNDYSPKRKKTRMVFHSCPRIEVSLQIYLLRTN